MTASRIQWETDNKSGRDVHKYSCGIKLEDDTVRSDDGRNAFVYNRCSNQGLNRNSLRQEKKNKFHPYGLGTLCMYTSAAGCVRT